MHPHGEGVDWRLEQMGQKKNTRVHTNTHIQQSNTAPMGPRTAVLCEVKTAYEQTAVYEYSTEDGVVDQLPFVSNTYEVDIYRVPCTAVVRSLRTKYFVQRFGSCSLRVCAMILPLLLSVQ